MTECNTVTPSDIAFRDMVKDLNFDSALTSCTTYYKLPTFSKSCYLHLENMKTYIYLPFRAVVRISRNHKYKMHDIRPNKQQTLGITTNRH